MSFVSICLGTFAMLAAVAGAAAQEPSVYHVTHKIVIGGEGGWDYLAVDPVAHRLYVSHSTRVEVVDLTNDSLVGYIPNTLGVHGIAIARDLGRGFTSNGRDSTVTIFDLETLAPLSTVKVTGRNPDAIAYDSVSHRVFVFNGGSANATVLNASTGAVAGTIPLSGKPEFSQTDGAGHIFVNIEDKSQIAKIDTRTMKVMATWPIRGCEEPTGLALDRGRQRLFAVCGNKVMAIVDAKSGKVIATVPTGDGTDGAAYDPSTEIAFSSNGEGTVTAVHHDGGDRYSVVGNVATQRGARTIAIDPSTHRLYLSTAEFGPTPAATADRPNPRPPVLPGSFVVLVLDR